MLIASLAGCGTVTDLVPSDLTPSDLVPSELMPFEDEVLTLGPDTFSVSARDLDPTIPTRVALIKAQDYCASRGREMFTVNIKVDPRWEKMGRRPVSTVTFQCLTKDQLDQARQRDDRSK